MGGLKPMHREALAQTASRTSETALIDFEASMAKWDRDRFTQALQETRRSAPVLQSTRFPKDGPAVRTTIARAPNSRWFNDWSASGKARVEIVIASSHCPTFARPAHFTAVSTDFIRDHPNVVVA